MDTQKKIKILLSFSFQQVLNKNLREVHVLELILKSYRKQKHKEKSESYLASMHPPRPSERITSKKENLRQRSGRKLQKMQTYGPF
ncbi:hypothetical protein EUGRSUZ_E03432 [Eucalyptus grandis]|uniref:Uncharacterized protein n=2 Tax=Eucalyptus grandis TaxID=71139 RepID=A0ACC3KZY1_EUCGR|nr:hypothetical protein EUGRSUZ_E03432 [Eucalyptus grandis]